MKSIPSKNMILGWAAVVIGIIIIIALSSCSAQRTLPADQRYNRQVMRNVNG